MERVALLFPGQGSQFVGMGKKLADEFPEANKILEMAERLSPIRHLCFEGPEEALRLTVNAQPAIFTVSLASYEVAKRLGLPIACAAGHSVGEYAALVAAQVLLFEEAFHLVKRRGEIMYEAGLKRPGSMSAILGLQVDRLVAICQEVASHGLVEVANINSPTQIVISGDPEAVKKAGEIAAESGAKRVIPLQVSGAFHSGLMEEAAVELGKELDKIEFRDAMFPIVANVTAVQTTKGSEIKALLKKQIREKVRWEESISSLIKEGITTFLEMEPGTVLSGLVRSIDKSAKLLKLDQLLEVGKT